MNWNQYCATFFQLSDISTALFWTVSATITVSCTHILRDSVVDEPTIRSTALNFKNDLFSYKQMNMPSLVFLNYIHFYTSIRFVVNHIYQFVNHEQIVLTTLYTPYVRIKRKRCTRRGWGWPPPNFFSKYVFPMEIIVFP